MNNHNSLLNIQNDEDWKVVLPTYGPAALATGAAIVTIACCAGAYYWWRNRRQGLLRQAQEQADQDQEMEEFRERQGMNPQPQNAANDVAQLHGQPVAAAGQDNQEQEEAV